MSTKIRLVCKFVGKDKENAEKFSDFFEKFRKSVMQEKGTKASSGLAVEIVWMHFQCNSTLLYRMRRIHPPQIKRWRCDVLAGWMVCPLPRPCESVAFYDFVTMPDGLCHVPICGHCLAFFGLGYGGHPCPNITQPLWRLMMEGEASSIIANTLVGILSQTLTPIQRRHIWRQQDPKWYAC